MWHIILSFTIAIVIAIAIAIASGAHQTLRFIIGLTAVGSGSGSGTQYFLNLCRPINRVRVLIGLCAKWKSHRRKALARPSPNPSNVNFIRKSNLQCPTLRCTMDFLLLKYTLFRIWLAELWIRVKRRGFQRFHQDNFINS